LAHQQGYLSDRSEVIAAQNVVVLDLGAGSLDVTVLTLDGSTIRALSTGGYDQLGGREWDGRLIDFIAESLMPKFGVDLRFEPTYAPRLKLQCEQVKRELSEKKEATIIVEWEGRTARATIPRDYFDELTEDLVESVRIVVFETIRASGLEIEQIDRVLLVGGSTRMPAIGRVLSELLGSDIKMTHSPDQAVACGAALHANRRLAQRRKEEPRFKIEDVASYSLGLVGTSRDTGRQVNRIIIPRNTRLPATVKCTLKTQKAGQDSLALQFVRGTSDAVEDCVPIGKWVLKNLPPELPAGSAITATVRCGEDGRIRVLAETGSGIDATRVVTQESGMTREELDHWREWVEMTHLCSIG
jgi:molecular chaperone DnaK